MLTKDQLDEIRDHAGSHSQSTIPEDETEKLYFAMLEMIDYQCCMYGDAPEGVTEEMIKEYLLERKDDVNSRVIEPPSYLGVLIGKFAFLVDDDAPNPQD